MNIGGNILQKYMYHYFFDNSEEAKLNSSQKHLRVTLDSKLSFNEYINDKIRLKLKLF